MSDLSDTTCDTEEKLPSFTCKSKMKWNEWLQSNGITVALVEGVDFDCSIETFRKRAYAIAFRRNLRCSIERTSNGVLLQSWGMYATGPIVPKTPR